jgi:hypothetical protein
MNPSKIIAVIGDVHHHIGLAAEGLERIEREIRRQIDQVFSVGDLGLFLNEADWEFLTGPKKYRTPAESPKIRRALAAWHWPLSMIAGNHEPFHRRRDWDASYFSSKLHYTSGGGWCLDLFRREKPNDGYIAEVEKFSHAGLAAIRKAGPRAYWKTMEGARAEKNDNPSVEPF